MPNPFVAIDNAILAPFDHLVLTLWNWFSIRRIHVIRFAALVWLLSSVMTNIVSGSFGFFTVLGVLIMLVFQGLEELAARYVQPKMHNAILFPGRTSGAWPVLRVLVFLMNNFFLLAYLHLGLLPGIIAALSIIAWLSLTWTWVPEDPPKRPKFSWNLVPAEAKS